MSKDGGPDCGTCGGTGHSRYRDEPEYVRWQAACRTMLATRTEGEG